MYKNKNHSNSNNNNNKQIFLDYSSRKFFSLCNVFQNLQYVKKSDMAERSKSILAAEFLIIHGSAYCHPFPISL